MLIFWSHIRSVRRSGEKGTLVRRRGNPGRAKTKMILLDAASARHGPHLGFYSTSVLLHAGSAEARRLDV